MPRKNIYANNSINAKNTNDTVVNMPENLAGKRPTAPKYLSADEKRVWKETVGRKDMHHFSPDMIFNLESYCRRMVTLHNIYENRNEFYKTHNTIDIISDKDILGMADKFQLMISREQKAITELAERLKLDSTVNEVDQSVSADVVNITDTKPKKAPWEK